MASLGDMQTTDAARFPRAARPAARPAAYPPARRPGFVLTYSPTVVVGFLCLLGAALLPMLGSKGALVFLLAGAGLIAMRPGATIAAMGRNWLIVALALWCLCSFTWSDYPGVTVRYGVQLLLTVMIGITLADRLPPAIFVKLVLVAQLMASLASFATGRSRGDGGGYLGIYASKNALAAASGILVIAAVAVLFDRRATRLWRVLALAGLAAGGMLLLMAKSTGAILAVGGTVGVFGLLYVLRRLDGPVRLAVVALATLLVAVVTVILTGMFDELSQAFLSATGKDLTLTGRTELWATAFGEIARHPLAGTGYQAFWVVGNQLAEQLWAEFGIETRTGFNFHNTLISNAVEIGLVGITIQAVLFYGALWAMLSWTIRSPGAGSIFFALFMVRQFVLMQVELVFFFQFDFSSIITIVAICHAAGFRQAARAVDRMPRAAYGRAGRAGSFAAAAGRGNRPSWPASIHAPSSNQWPRARRPIRRDG